MYLNYLIGVFVVFFCIMGLLYYLIPLHEPDSISIPEINVTENIHNTTNDAEIEGVYMSKHCYSPAEGDVVIFGHRTQGNHPFVNLDLLGNGDKVSIVYSNHEYEYIIQNKRITSDSDINITPVHGGDKLYLITCHPRGKCTGRLIYEAKMLN